MPGRRRARPARKSLRCCSPSTPSRRPSPLAAREIDTSVAALDTPPARAIGQYCFLVPLRPDFSQHRPDPRFDRYRDRVGRLFRSDREVGLVLVEVHPYAEVVGGWLWWRRWGPSRDALFLYTTVDGQFSDHVVQDAADDELAEYDAGRFWYYGEPLDVRWTGAEESAHLRSSWFAAGRVA